MGKADPYQENKADLRQAIITQRNFSREKNGGTREDHLKEMAGLRFSFKVYTL